MFVYRYYYFIFLWGPAVFRKCRGDDILGVKEASCMQGGLLFYTG